jgi:thiol-disulfide isomerase/thioredoxin
VAVHRRRLLVSSVVAALIVSLAAGWAFSRNQSGDDIVNINNAALAEPSGAIPTAPQLDGSALPDAELVAADGTVLNLRELVGQPMVVNLWFTTCEPCKRELRDFAEVHAELGDRVRFVGVNPVDDPAGAAAFAAARGVDYELYRDTEAAVPTKLDIGTFPATLFVTPDGTIMTVRQGALTADSLRATIDEELLT